MKYIILTHPTENFQIPVPTDESNRDISEMKKQKECNKIVDVFWLLSTDLLE